ncbi:hypothetical protein B0H16DRAFT_1477688 [Mycena metata]|uniref:Protein kinase domain-containing protein n=1 Tax=Mycena metata TaxID=1033252 RepID=A0AAD7MFY1_9AGAR|nr:hypothetical protein B0H16DRAFT_1477688 [Mycena metata]
MKGSRGQAEELGDPRPGHREVDVVIAPIAPPPPPPPHPRALFIRALKDKDISPSQFAPATYGSATDSAEKLRTHPAADRPLAAQPDIPNTLLCGVFRRFEDNVQSSHPSPADYHLAVALRGCMSEIHTDKQPLRDAVNELFTMRFAESMAPHWIYGTYMVDGLQFFNTTKVALVRYKEDASEGPEPQFQVAHDYSIVTAHAAEEDGQSRLPLLLMTCVGSVLTFLGGVWNCEKPVVQKLFDATASFDWSQRDEPAMKRAARLMCAYTIAIAEISKYENPAQSPQFPDVTSWEDSQHQKHQFHYLERADHLLFRAIDESNHPLLIKFTQHPYSAALHTLCAEKGFAPELKAAVNIGGWWTMVIMVDLSGEYHSIGERGEFLQTVTQSRLEQFKNAVRGMHDAGFVHGDIHLGNILVHKTDTSKPLLLVGFDWGGSENDDVCYPGVMNTVVRRHPEACSGLPIKAEHDRFMLNVL